MAQKQITPGSNNKEGAPQTRCGLCCKVVLTLAFLTLLFAGIFMRRYARLLLDLFSGEGEAAIELTQGVIQAACTHTHVGDWNPPNQTYVWADEFRAEWRAIRDELHSWEKANAAIPLFKDLDESQDVISRHWSTLWLKLYGEHTEAARFFPHTMSAVARTTASTAVFSIMPAGEGLALHRGENKGVLRYHLALEVPQPPPGKTKADEPLRLIVAEKMGYKKGEQITVKAYEWEEGGDLLFDDTFLHRVENKRSTGRRVILWMDVPRTDCGSVINAVFSVVTHHFIKYLPRVRDIIDAANAYSALPRADPNAGEL